MLLLSLINSCYYHYYYYFTISIIYPKTYLFIYLLLSVLCYFTYIFCHLIYFLIYLYSFNHLTFLASDRLKKVVNFMLKLSQLY